MDVLFVWWLVIQVLGLSAFPLTRYMFRWLPDQGYAFAKPVGILICSYILWLGCSFGIVDNDRSTIIAIVVLVAGVTWFALRIRLEGLRDWWRRNWVTVAVVEVLFAVSLSMLALLRAYDPAIAFTEKPMEYAFLNGVLRSDRFPPVDPWMSGHSISYYYFGYVVVGFLTKLSGLASNYTFNLSIAMLFALSMVGAFGVVSNVIRLTKPRLGNGQQLTAMGYGLLGSAFVAILGNIEGVIEVLNARGFIPESLGQWLHIKDLPVGAPSLSWLPSDSWWWFRASRVVGDFDPLTGVSHDYTINEFPFFSFLLGDLHPHVLALPWAMVCLALALNIIASHENLSVKSLLRQRLDLLMLIVMFGGLAFLNSWDLPTYSLVAVLVYAIKQYWQRGTIGILWLKEVILFAAVLLAGSVILYLPFYITLSSQAQGLGLTPVHTKLHHFLIFWGPFVFLIGVFLLSEALELSRSRSVTGRSPVGRLRLGSMVVLAVFVMLLALLMIVHAEVLAVLLVGLVVGVSILRAIVTRQDAPLATGWAGAVTTPSPIEAGALWADTPIAAHASGGTTADWPGGHQQSGTEASLAGVDGGTGSWPHRAAFAFVLLLIVVSLLLLAGPEVLFLRDLFGNRMNTVFKVYYQVWTMLAIASACVLWHFMSRPVAANSSTVGRAAREVVTWLFIGLVVACLVYPVTSAYSKSGGFVSVPSLDGMAYLAKSNPDDYEAINWLRSSVKGTPVILEAAGGSYGQAGRVSANTGLPTVVGWDFHETQWRGSSTEASRRKQDVDTIYRTSDIEVAQRLLTRYHITYVYLGDLERATYGDSGETSLRKFSEFMDVAYRNAGVVIYRVRGTNR